MFPTADTEDISQVTSLGRNSSPSRNARNSSDNTQVAKQNNNRDLTLNMLVKEMVFCVALALTTYGALHNTYVSCVHLTVHLLSHIPKPSDTRL